jgi:hypothetical protein
MKNGFVVYMNAGDVTEEMNTYLLDEVWCPGICLFVSLVVSPIVRKKS